MPALLPPRRLILLSGPRVDAGKAARALIEKSGLSRDQYAWPGPAENTRRLLGQDRALVVIDTYTGLNPDMIGRMSGMIQAGGALLLICPALEEWANTPDPETRKLTPYPLPHESAGTYYLERWVRLLSAMKGVEIYTPADRNNIPEIVPARPDNLPSTACTDDQQLAINAVLKATLGQRRRPAVLSADRGRGKSAALGLAAGQLLLNGQAREIIITAAGFAQAGNVFKHAQAVLKGAELLESEKKLLHPNGELRYVEAEALLSESIQCDLLIVDEASALGVARLEKLLTTYPRLVFATTEHGYEGSGRGFALKFRQLISKISRGQHSVSLHTAVRWADSDPLEAWMNRLLLLNLQISPLSGKAITRLDTLTFRPLQQSELAGNEVLLSRVFGLLVEAHYQTRPVDARFLLDAPNSLLYIAEQGAQLLGLVWLMLEGSLEKKIAYELVAGRRRPQGHLVPQTLAAHLGLETAAITQCARIQRIVVVPEIQGQGIGSWMLAQLEQHMEPTVDYLASSFGANLLLNRLWKKAGYATVRVSDRLRAASGLHSAVVLKARSPQGEQLLEQAQQVYRGQYPAQLADSLKRLAPELACGLAPRVPVCEPLEAHALKAAILFAWANRPFSSSLAALSSLGLTALLNDTLVFTDEKARLLLITRILQHRNWSKCGELLKLGGQAACVALLRQGTQEILEQCYPRQEMMTLREKYGCMTEI